ncbi:MAG: stage II sporulation protein R [Oscillospiraceae bacterium]
MKNFNLAVFIGLIFSIMLSSFSVFASDCDDIRHDVLRLHILADSDSKEDQTLKLQVRDKILSLDATLFSQALNLSDAKNIAASQLQNIKEIAEAEIKARGYDYKVKVELKNMYFSTREYDTFTLPAGKYDAVRITIGSGAGKNWWCVLYPPLCIPAASSQSEFDDLLTKEQIEIVGNKQKYKFKFATVEIYEKLKNILFD